MNAKSTFVAATMSILASAAWPAADTTWNGGDGAWTDETKWSNGVPTSENSVAFSSSGGTISLASTTYAVTSLGEFINNSTPLVFTAEEGGGLSFSDTGDFCVGRVGHGTLRFNGGTYTFAGCLRSGWYYSGWSNTLPPSTGLVEVVAAAVTFKELRMGTDHAHGVLHVSGGGKFATSDYSMVVGNNNTGALGRIVVDDGTVESAADIYIANGESTTGEVVLNNGGTLTGKYMGIGQATGGTGSVTLNSGSTLTLTGGLNIGNYGTGTLTLNGGSLSFSGTPNIGNTASATGYVHVVSGTFKSGGNDIYVGKSGMGVMTIDGGTVSCPYWLDMNRDATAVEGTTINLNGGVLNVGLVNNAGLNQATFNWNGGTFKPTGKYEYIFRSETSGMIDVNVLAGGAILDTDGHNVSIQPVLSGVGNFVKRGTGNCWIRQAANLGRGIDVEAGTLDFELGMTSGTSATSPMKEISVADGATLDLSGAEVYVQHYTLAGVAQTAGTYEAHGGTIHVIDATVATATWTGDAGDGDVTNPVNWTCYDANGVVVWDALPDSTTAVTVPYATNLPDFDESDYGSFYMTISGTVAPRGNWSVPDVVKTAIAWYDFDDENTVTVADGCATAVANKGTAGTTLDATAYNNDRLAAYGLNTVNGRNLVSLTNSCGFFSSGKPAIDTDGDRTLIVFFRRQKDTYLNAEGTSYINDFYSLGIETTGANEDYAFRLEDWGWSNRPFYNHTGVATSSYHSGSDWQLWEMKADDLTVTAKRWMAGTDLMTSTNHIAATLPMHDNSRIYLGERNLYGSPSSGDLAEAMVFDKALSDDDFTAIQSYISAKWLTVPETDMAALPTSIQFSGDDAVYNLGGGNWTFANIAGSGTISSGNVTVTGTITITVNDDGTIDPLVIDGSLTLGAGAKLIVKNARKLSAGTALGAITATGGIRGAFASVETEPEGVRLRAKVEANDVTIMRRSGLFIIIR